MISATVNAWANSLGVEFRTVTRALAKAGIKSSGKITAKEIADALFGDEYKQRVRNLTKDADRKEREEKEAFGELVNRSLMEKEIAEFYTLPLAQALTSLPSSLSNQCNPVDPELAYGALLRWVEETKKLIRGKIKK